MTVDDTFDHSPRICNCCPTRGTKVGTKGPWDSPVVILGEGPGVQEVKKGIPFCGPSGNLIASNWPYDLGFKYEDCFVINAFQCFIPGSAKNEELLFKATYCCRERLSQMIGLAPRKVILCFGKWAGISLFHDDGYKPMSARGIVSQIMHPGRPGEVTEVVSILHPAYLLRGQGKLPQFQSDIRKGIEIVKDIRQTAFTPPDYTEIVNGNHARELYEYLLELKGQHAEPLSIGADIETSGFSFYKDRILTVGLFPSKEDNTAYIFDWDRILHEWKKSGISLDPRTGMWCIRGSQIPGAVRKSRLYMWLKAILEMNKSKASFVWQNGKFDKKFLAMDGINARLDEDLYLADYTLDERPGGHDLEEIAKNRLGCPPYEHKIKALLPKKGASYIHIPKPNLWEYLAWDVKNTQESFSIVKQEVFADEQCTRLYENSLKPYQGLLTRLEMRGFYVDKRHVAANDLELQAEIATAQDYVSELAGGYLNPNSPIQVKHHLYTVLGLKIKGRTPKDTTKETLDKLFEVTRHPLLKAIRDYRRKVKLHSTYIKAVYTHICADGRIHSTYNLGSTPTGRLASSDPNLQNIPREARIRRMYRSSEDFDHERVIVEGDYNTAELRALGALSGDQVLIDIFADPNRSLHDEVAIQMYGEGFTPDQRIRAKAVNFGIPYGREAFSLAEEFDMSTEEAQELINSWFAQFPTAAEFIAACRAAPSAGQTLLTMFGRRRRPGVVSPEILHDLMNQFANYFMQSVINDFTLQSALELEDKLWKLDSFFVNLVHDAVLVDSPKSAAREVRDLLKKHMPEVPKRFIKTPVEFLVDCKIGTHWGELVKEEKYVF